MTITNCHTDINISATRTRYDKPRDCHAEFNNSNHRIIYTNIMIFDFLLKIKRFSLKIKNLLHIIYNILLKYFVKFNFN